MQRGLLLASRALIAVAIPFLLVGNMLWLLAQPWLVQALYALRGIPVPIPGLTASEQSDLGILGVEAIQPAGSGADVLTDARLPGGEAAFTAREVRHMRDVEAVVDAFTIGWGVAIVLIVLGVLAARRAGARGVVLRSAAAGAWLTFALVVSLGAGMLLSFDSFFVAFHGVFFEGDSWRFAADATLLQLYPERFWVLSGALAIGLVLVQALAILLAARHRAGRYQLAPTLARR